MNNNTVKICKIHGDLLDHQVTLIKRKYPYLRCRLCAKETVKKSVKRHIEKYRERDNKNYHKTRERHIELRNYRVFGISKEEHLTLIKIQNNKCACCKKEETSLCNNKKDIRKLSIDHCHKTGKIRGLLCSKCNFGIGYFDDSIEKLYEAIKYLKAHKK